MVIKDGKTLTINKREIITVEKLLHFINVIKIELRVWTMRKRIKHLLLIKNRLSVPVLNTFFVVEQGPLSQ